MNRRVSAADKQFAQGMELHRQGNSVLAEIVYRQVLQQDPQHARAHFMLAMLLHSAGRLDDALNAFMQAAKSDASWAEAHMNAGVMLYELQRFEQALHYHERARKLAPANLDVLVNLGNALFELGRHDEALEAFRRVVAASPNAQDVRMNLANALRDMRQFPKALAAYDEALALNQDNADVHFNRSLCLLTMGRLEDGWSEYEWRRQLPSLYDTQRKFAAPPWTGLEPLGGRTILLHAEQGLGDTIQFCRYASAVAALGARVLLEVQRPLANVVAGLEGVERVIARGESPGAYDFHCPLLSLPHALHTTLATVPGNVPYLRADATRIERWRTTIDSHTGTRIGLAWAGNTAYRQNHHRSVALSRLLEALPIDVHAWSLQKEVSAADADLIAASSQMARFESNDFPDTAAQIASLDLVISVDTSIAHLAAALGKPVWLLLGFNADWRWMDARDDSPWYPNVRLFRQARPGEWAPLVERVAAALREFAVRQ